MTTIVENVNANRLRAELLGLGMDSQGSRSELVTRLKQAGIMKINLDISPNPPSIDLEKRYENRTNVYIGNGAGVKNKEDHQLFIANNEMRTLIHGEFKKKRVNIDSILNIKEENFESDLIGNEGDIRREGSNIYMYRTSGVHAGWYPLQFGNCKII